MTRVCLAREKTLFSPPHTVGYPLRSTCSSIKEAVNITPAPPQQHSLQQLAKVGRQQPGFPPQTPSANTPPTRLRFFVFFLPANDDSSFIHD